MCRRHPVRPLILILATEIRLLLATPFFPLFRSNGSATYTAAVFRQSRQPVQPAASPQFRRVHVGFSSIGDAPKPISTAAARAARTRQRPDVSSLAPALSAGAAARCTPPRPTSALLRGRRRHWPLYRLDDTKQPTPTSQSSMRVCSDLKIATRSTRWCQPPTTPEVTKRNGRHRHTPAASDCAILASRGRQSMAGEAGMATESLSAARLTLVSPLPKRSHGSPRTRLLPWGLVDAAAIPSVCATAAGGVSAECWLSLSHDQSQQLAPRGPVEQAPPKVASSASPHASRRASRRAHRRRGPASHRAPDGEQRLRGCALSHSAIIVVGKSIRHSSICQVGSRSE